MRHLAMAVALVVLQAALACAALAAPAIWYEDNNLGRAGGMPPDFIEKFHQPETFSQATRHIGVYLMRANVLNKLDDAFLVSHFEPYLRNNGIKLAINAGGATWTQAPGRERAFKMNIRLLERLKQLGLEVHYISLQSVLSKPLVRNGKTLRYPMTKRIEDIVAYAAAVRPIYPRAEIGIIDALPSHGRNYRGPYRLLKDALLRAGLALSYIHLDMPFEIPHERQLGITWEKVREIERYVEDELRLQFGFFTTSRTGGVHSSQAFHERVMAALECYAGVSGTPRDLIIASWFPHPNTTIPESATGSEYPAMRTVLEFGRRLEQIGNTVPSRTAQRARPPDWLALCVA